MDTETIIQHLWSLSEGEFVFLPVRRGTYWNEGSAFHADKVGGELWFKGNTPAVSVDNYFSPLKYHETHRRREYVGKPGVIFADLDDGAILLGFTPHLIIASSDMHQHAYWFLERPAPLDIWEAKARGLSMVLKADPGGWDATQVLRIPGSLNHKYDPPQEVRVVQYLPDLPLTKLNDLPSAPVFTHRPLLTGSDPAYTSTTEELARRMDTLRPVFYKLPLETQSLLSLDRKHKVGDRSMVIWKVGGDLLEAGLTVSEAFRVIQPMAWNKHRDKPKILMAGLLKQAQGRE